MHITTNQFVGETPLHKKASSTGNPAHGKVINTTKRVFAGCAIAAVCLVTFPTQSEAAAILPGFNSSSLPANDDGSTGSVSLGFSNSINFFGTNYSSLFVNNNGNVTFNAPLSTFTPFGLGSTSIPIIAPFFADVDTRGAGSNVVSYGGGTVGGNEAFGVNWIDVGYFSQHTDKLNSFQLVLINRADLGVGDFDILFNYDKIQWETGDASGGTNGLGGSSAAAGYANGTGTFSEILGSNVNGAFLNGGANALASGGNTGTPGSYQFLVRNGVVLPPDPIPPEPPQQPPVTPIPETGNLLVGLACIAMIGLSRQRSLACRC